MISQIGLRTIKLEAYGGTSHVLRCPTHATYKDPSLPPQVHSTLALMQNDWFGSVRMVIISVDNLVHDFVFKFYNGIRYNAKLQVTSY